VIEREIKAKLTDPATVVARLVGAGARLEFRGLMFDRRYDRDGILLARDEVLRLRRYQEENGSTRTVIGWKGPVSVERGTKLRREIEIAATGDAAGLLEALGYRVAQAIDRFVESYRLGEATVRLEWYPRMDVLVEVEGSETAIEAAVAVIGEPRESFTADSLAAFAARHRAAGGRPALSLEELGDEKPGWRVE
jgi:predicted adenylyl cyclase CyaB